MDVEKTQQVLQHHPDLMVYLIYADGQGKNKVWYSPSLKKAIQGAENPSDKK